ncbi:MAG: hypothetical protein ACE37M_09525 [Henriciella sp.]
MLGVLMLLSFVFPLAGALMIRRYAWIGACAAMSAMVAVPVIYKLATNTQDPMGWGFILVLVFFPALIGVTLGGLITALRRWRSGPGEVTLLKGLLAAFFSIISVGYALYAASDF